MTNLKIVLSAILLSIPCSRAFASQVGSGGDDPPCLIRRAKPPKLASHVGGDSVKLSVTADDIVGAAQSWGTAGLDLPPAPDAAPGSRTRTTLDTSLPDPTFADIQPLILQGKVVLLEFWSPRAPRQAEPESFLERLNKKYGGDLVIIRVVVGEQPGEATAFLRDHKLPYKAVYDSAGRLAARWKVKTLPTLRLILPCGMGRMAVPDVSLEYQSELEKAIKAAVERSDTSA